jgi:hypothetical protein
VIVDSVFARGLELLVGSLSSFSLVVMEKAKPRFTVAVCLAVLDKLLESGDLASPFVDPVDQVLYPEYMRIVWFPMDLGTVRARLREDPSYAGDSFAADVRLCFSNAMLFNEPNDAVFVAASTLLARFEREWLKFADTPPELPPQAQIAPSKRVVAEPGKIVLTMKSKKRSALSTEAAEEHKKFGLFRARSEALMSFCELLASGVLLKKAATATMSSWGVVPPSGMPVIAIEADARCVISALEDTQSAGRVGKWLKKSLIELDETSKSDFLLYHVVALLAAEASPFLEVFVLLQSPGLLASKPKLWKMMFVVLAKSACARRIVDVLQKLVFGPRALYTALLKELKDNFKLVNVSESLDRFGKWLLVDLKPARTDLLALTCTGYPKLRQSIGQLALDAISQAHDVDSFAELIQLSYGSDVSATLVKDLLVAGMADKAGLVANVLLQRDASLPRVLLLLDECCRGAKHSDDFEPLVRKLMKLFVALVPVSQSRAFLKPLLASSQSTRQQHFANFVASAFFSDSSRTSLDSLLPTVALVSSVPNAISVHVVTPVIATIEALLKQRDGVRVQTLLEAIFAIECANSCGWSTWKEQREALLRMLIDWSAETKLLHQRIVEFRKVSLMCARLEPKTDVST